MASILSSIKKYLEVTRADSIARRYLVMNGFDGALVTLGLVLGAYIAEALDAKLILSAGFGASIAMGISGASGAYMAEKAERMKGLKELERAMFSMLDDTLVEKAARTAVLFVAFVDALAPVTATAISLSPFILSVFGLLEVQSALILSLIFNALTLFTLGVFLGRFSRSNPFLYGGLMVSAGFATAIVMLLLKVLGAG